MTAAAYTTDLTDITTAESTTGWSALGGGASGLATNADSSMQGVFGIGKPVSAAEKGQVFGSGGTTIGANRHVYTWIFLTTPGLANTLALRGLAVVIGNTTTNYCQYHVEGNDTYGAAGRVGKCYPVDPSVYTSNTGSSPYRTNVGTPNGTFAQFGATANITGTIKGENLVVDAIRHGTGVFVTGGTTPDPAANFDSLSIVNDYNDATNGYNRWGIFTKVAGSYELQGRLYIGFNSSLTEVQTTFTDSNRNIVIPANPHVAAGFNQIEFGHASSVITWNNINVTSLNTASPGTVNVSANDPQVDLNTCVFTDMAGFTFRPSTTATNCTFRRIEGVSIVNGGVLDTCTFDKCTTTIALSLNSSQLANVTDCTFISDGTGHALNLGSVAASTSVNWQNFLQGYVAGTTGSPVTTGTSGNEAILCNVASGQTLTINVAAGYTIPSVKNDGPGSVNVVAGQVTTLITVKDVVTGANVVGARVYLIAGAGGPLTQGTVIFNTVTDSNGQVQDIRSLASAQPVEGWVRKGTATIYYKTSPITATISNSTGLTLTVQLVRDE